MIVAKLVTHSDARMTHFGGLCATTGEAFLSRIRGEVTKVTHRINKSSKNKKKRCVKSEKGVIGATLGFWCVTFVTGLCILPIDKLEKAVTHSASMRHRVRHRINHVERVA